MKSNYARTDGGETPLDEAVENWNDPNDPTKNNYQETIELINARGNIVQLKIQEIGSVLRTKYVTYLVIQQSVVNPLSRPYTFQLEFFRYI